MGTLTEAEMHDALDKIDKALPSDGRQAFGILVAATAAKAIDAGVPDAAAVDGLITTLKSIRAEANRTRVN